MRQIKCRKQQRDKIFLSKTSMEDYRPYKCQMDIAFPSALDSKRAMDVLSVDEEISGDRVVKTYSVISSGGDGGEKNVLRVNIEATEAKLLRVSVSSFYDMLKVVVKCYQEFGSDPNC